MSNWRNKSHVPNRYILVGEYIENHRHRIESVSHLLDKAAQLFAFQQVKRVCMRGMIKPELACLLP